jgi:hypothetical protein
MAKTAQSFGITLLTVVVLVTSCSLKQPVQEEWIPLFNGKNLDGWTVKIKGYEAGVNFGNTFRVEDSLLKVRYDQYDSFENRFGHLFYKNTFSHYVIRVEYRFVGEQCPGGAGWAYRNSGIMIHGQPLETMEKEQDFPVSIEVQLLGGDSTGVRPTANLCTPGTNVVINGQLITDHCISSSSPTYRGEEWVTVEAEVYGGEVIRHIVNGDTVLVYHSPQLDERDSAAFRKLLPVYGDKIIHSGTISLQAESHPVDFRKVELKILR